jgi:prevent-host-death family protein
MAMIVNMHEAKTQLSRLVERASEGEEIVIAKAGTPRAKLVPYREEPKPRQLGLLRGQIWMADDWDSDEVNEEIARTFYGDAEDPV